MPLILFDPLRECARMFLATIILEVNTLEQQDRICYHQNICNNRIDAIGLTHSATFMRMQIFDVEINQGG
jgi:hypothetical protein